MAQLEPLMQRNFLEYASYVVLDRAIPDLRDGLKPVQRRILHTLFEMDDGRFHKVANAIGETMKLHPHGDKAIGDALVVLANKDYFIERQGNFGNLLTGHPAAASRYIECRLTPLARETLFNKEITSFTNSYDGRKQEPLHLPAKLPVLLLLGVEGIAVGMATRILPHNFAELLSAQIEILRGRPVEILPDFPQGGLMDASEYADGRGRVFIRARIEERDDKTLVVRELPFGTSTESLIQSIEGAAQRGQLKIASIDDFTTEKAEIEITLPRGVHAGEVLPQLFAYTDCEVSISSNFVAVRDGRPQELRASEALALLSAQLQETLQAELEYDLAGLRDKQHWLSLERIFIEKRVYKRIEAARTREGVRREVWDGMHLHAAHFVRPMVAEDTERLLQIRIRRISAYDIAKNTAELAEVESSIAEHERKLGNMKRTTIAYLKDLLRKFGGAYPRRTQITRFQAVDRRAVARQDILLAYDPRSGFFGSKIEGSRHRLKVSEFERILLICRDGSWRVCGPVDKLLMPARVLHCAIFDPEEGATFTLVYRTAQKIAYAKKFTIRSFIKDREYRLFQDPAGRIDLLLAGDDASLVQLDFAPAPRQRVRATTFDLGTIHLKGVGARGNRLSPKPVAKVTRLRP